jgi:transcriptional regulator with XRE-family HTH domain
VLRLLCDDSYSQRALADASGLGIGTVLDLFSGRTDPTLGTLLAIVEALELASVEQLLGPLGTETMIARQRLTR